MFKLEASIVDVSNQKGAEGRDEILGVDWKSQSSNGSIWENGNIIKGFHKDEKQKEVPNNNTIRC